MAAPSETLTPDGLEAALRRIGAERYHNLHPFHRLLHPLGRQQQATQKRKMPPFRRKRAHFPLKNSSDLYPLTTNH